MVSKSNGCFKSNFLNSIFSDVLNVLIDGITPGEFREEKSQFLSVLTSILEMGRKNLLFFLCEWWPIERKVH